MKGEGCYRYRAVEKHGQTVDVLLTEHRNKEAALRFLKQAIRRNGLPETITSDGSDAHAAAIKRYHQEHGTAITIRQVQYLNTVVEQEHRAVKRVTRPMQGLQAVDAAPDTLVGIARMHRLKTCQMVVQAGGEGLTAAELFYALAASSSRRQGLLSLQDFLSIMCDGTLRPRGRSGAHGPARRRGSSRTKKEKDNEYTRQPS